MGKGSKRKNASPFIYLDYRDNHVVCDGREEALSQFVSKTYGGMQHKLRNAHSSNSEDALTWSCFDALWRTSKERRQAALIDLWELAFPGMDAPPTFHDAVLEIGKRYGDIEPTEVDASFEAPNLLVFIEAKLYSAMSTADESRPFDQLARKIRTGCRVAKERDAQFFFIVLDIAPPEALASTNPGVSLDVAETAKSPGFGSKWITAYWFRRYQKPSPLRAMLERAPPVREVNVEELARRIGWLSWADVFKLVLRACMPTLSSTENPADRKESSPQFERYIGIDYSGASDSDTPLKGLQVFASDRGGGPVKVGGRWSRRSLADYLLYELETGPPTIVGIDHAFSLPEKYFEDQGIPKSWDHFLTNFSDRWRTANPGITVRAARGADGNGSAATGYTKLKRRTEARSGSAKSAFLFDVPGQVACSSHAGIPWLRVLRERLRGSAHFWPFDGWDVPRDKSVVVEVYPRLWATSRPTTGTDDEKDAFAVAKRLREADGSGELRVFLKRPTSDDLQRAALFEGWILGVS